MTINEHIDAWDNNRLMYMSYQNDGKIEVRQTHGLSLYSSIKLSCETANITIE